MPGALVTTFYTYPEPRPSRLDTSDVNGAPPPANAARSSAIVTAVVACSLFAFATMAAAKSVSIDRATEEKLKDVYCAEPDLGWNCSPEEVSRAGAHQAADEANRRADQERRYKEQQALVIPATKADLTLLCGGQTVQVWFSAGLLTWGAGANRRVWRLDKVSPTEIIFKRVGDYDEGGGFTTGPHGLFDAEGQIDRVSGRFSLSIPNGAPFIDPQGACSPAAAKF